MKRIRIGKDFAVKWSIYAKTETGREPYEIDSKNTILRLVTPHKKENAGGFLIEGNTITWVFRGKEQKRTGVYALELVQRNGEDGMITIDTCKAFELVAHSCEETDNATGDVVIDSLVFESEVTLAPLGYNGSVDVDVNVDDNMSDVSENPVQNKVVKAYIDDTASGKQNIIADLEQIRKGAASGATAVQPAALNPYAKTQEVNEALKAKQDTIPDIDTIRQGAEKGNTAVQPEALAPYAKTEDVNSALKELDNKIDTLSESVIGALNTEV